MTYDRNDGKWRSSGFTLIELVIYVSIMTVVLLAVGSFATMVIQSRIRQQTIAEVEGEGAQIVQYFTQAVRNADGITLPAPGASGQTLSISGATNTIFSVVGGTIQSTQNGSATTLTSSRVAMSNAQFINTGAVGSPGAMKMQFTLTFINPKNRNEYRYSQTFYGSATVR